MTNITYFFGDPIIERVFTYWGISRGKFVELGISVEVVIWLRERGLRLNSGYSFSQERWLNSGHVYPSAILTFEEDELAVEFVLWVSSDMRHIMI
jgi:hypothetical protein